MVDKSKGNWYEYARVLACSFNVHMFYIKQCQLKMHLVTIYYNSTKKTWDYDISNIPYEEIVNINVDKDICTSTYVYM